MNKHYDRKTIVEMFDGHEVSPILPYDSIEADANTIKESTQAGGCVSISGAQPKYAMVVDNGLLRFAREGEQGHYILKPHPFEHFSLMSTNGNDYRLTPAYDYIKTHLHIY